MKLICAKHVAKNYVKSFAIILQRYAAASGEKKQSEKSTPMSRRKIRDDE